MVILKVIKTLVPIIFFFSVWILFFFFYNSWDHKTGIYTQLQSDNGRHTKTGYDAKVSLVINNNWKSMEVQESDPTDTVSWRLPSLMTSE